jgi:hypothetical protein
MSVSQQEKHIYNKFLAVTRSAQNKPFKLRKKFDNLDDTTILCLKKLSLFFNRFSHVDADIFFKAPWEIYLDKGVFDLKFYTTQRALKVYTLYMQRQAQKKPDHEEQLYDIKRSLQYIYRFCVNTNISIDEYTSHMTSGLNTFVLHLKEHNVNIYTLFGFGDFETKLRQLDREQLKFILGDIITNLAEFRTNYMSSQHAKTFIKLGINKIKQNQKIVELQNK